MRSIVAAAVASFAMLGGCAYPYAPRALPLPTQPAPPARAIAMPVAPAMHPVAGAPAELRPTVTILISIDGFRPDYLDRGASPHLTRLAADGVTAAMRPSFPSKTFPNHWTLVTGMVPDHHGITANRMEDVARPGEVFTMASDDPFWWNEAEPIWVTAERAGLRTAAMFWPGSNVAWGGTKAAAWPHDVIGGTRPDEWQHFDQAVDGRQRVDAILDWLRRPAATRPQLLTLYFDTVDTAGHRFGPFDARTTQAVAEVDARIGDLLVGLRALRQPANLVIVSDHGMAPISPDRVIAMDRIVAPADARLVEAGPYATIVPAPGREAVVEAALLAPHPHMQCWRKGALPARFRYGANPRVPPILCLAEDGRDGGWTIGRTGNDEETRNRGAHGYDNDALDMRALFIASGPAFARGKRLPTFDNVDVAPLLRDLLGLPARSGLDGDDRPVRTVLRR